MKAAADETMIAKHTDTDSKMYSSYKYCTRRKVRTWCANHHVTSFVWAALHYKPDSQIFAPHEKSFAHASCMSGSYTSSSVRRRRTGSIPAVKSRLWMSSCHKRRGYQSLWVWPCKLSCQPANSASGHFSSTSSSVKTSTHRCSSMTKSNQPSF